MRWFWIDRFTVFEKGKHATAVKSVSLSEDHLHDHFPAFPVMPASLIIEGMAQTGGILLGSVNEFRHAVVLAKIPKMTFSSWATPGDTLTYQVELQDAREEGGVVSACAKVGDRLVAEGEIFFAHVNKGAGGDGADQQEEMFRMNLLGVLGIGKAGDGVGLGTPPR